MDKNHTIEAPNNDSLENIEQLTDRSQLSGMYFAAHNEWEGKEILSKEDREMKRDQEQLQITRSIRKWFALIGFLVPTPVILLVLLIGLASVYLAPDNFRLMLPLSILAIGLWGAILFLSFRKVYRIFYQHALTATPFILILFALIGLSAQASFLVILPLGAEPLINVILVSSITYVASIILSGILLTIWTAPRLSGSGKLGAIMLLVIALLVTIGLLVIF